jgi:cell filamentation protein
MSKKSIRFFNDREVRAVWDDENDKWWFSATDIVRAINDEEDNKKCRNYWKYLKGKLAKDGIQLVSVTNHFKFEAPDGKQRFADALDSECVQTVAQHYPNNRANAFMSRRTKDNISILDTFEGSIQNLEAQLEQRQKQYEYYRNKLLSFE